MKFKSFLTWILPARASFFVSQTWQPMEHAHERRILLFFRSNVVTSYYHILAQIWAKAWQNYIFIRCAMPSDFGLSKLYHTQSGLRNMYGTFQYMAPEVEKTGGGSYTKKIDIWSLGVVPYNCLSQNIADHRKKIDQVSPENWNDVQRHLHANPRTFSKIVYGDMPKAMPFFNDYRSHETNQIYFRESICREHITCEWTCALCRSCEECENRADVCED